MKNANIFIDVDLTLVDAEGKLYPGVEESLRRFQTAGCHLFLWSSQGVEYARNVAVGHGLARFFTGYMPKPDVIIDDLPVTVWKPHLFDIHRQGPWPELTDRILSQPED